MTLQSTAAGHAAGKGSEPDSVFAVVARIREAKTQPGAEKIIDGSIGAMRNEDGSFSILPVVDEVYRSLPPEDLMDYATIPAHRSLSRLPLTIPLWAISRRGPMRQRWAPPAAAAQCAP